MQTETARVVGVVNDGTQRTQDGVATVERTRAAFEAIGGAVEDMAARVGEITDAVQEITRRDRARRERGRRRRLGRRAVLGLGPAGLGLDRADQRHRAGDRRLRADPLGHGRAAPRPRPPLQARRLRVGGVVWTTRSHPKRAPHRHTATRCATPRHRRPPRPGVPQTGRLGAGRGHGRAAADARSAAHERLLTGARAILSGMRPYEGLLTAMVTPFRADGSVDEEGAVAIGRHLLANGSHGLVVAGTTGEAATMTDEEHLGLIALIVRELGDECVVIGGTGSNDTRHAIHLTEKAVEAGVDAVLSVTPYYNKPNRRGILAHFGEVARAAGDTPVVLYNIPGRTRGQHGPGPAGRAGPDRRHRGRQAGQFRRAAADRRAGRAGRQRRHLRPVPGHRRRGRHLRRLARRAATRCAGCTTSRTARAEIDASLQRPLRRRCSSPPAPLRSRPR